MTEDERLDNMRERLGNVVGCLATACGLNGAVALGCLFGGEPRLVLLFGFNAVLCGCSAGSPNLVWNEWPVSGNGAEKSQDEPGSR